MLYELFINKDFVKRKKTESEKSLCLHIQQVLAAVYLAAYFLACLWPLAFYEKQEPVQQSASISARASGHHTHICIFFVTLL